VEQKQEGETPCVVLRALLPVIGYSLSPFVQHGVVAKVIGEVIGQTCQVRVDIPPFVPRCEADVHRRFVRARQLEHLHHPQTAVTSQKEPIAQVRPNQEEIIAQWQEIIQKVSGQRHRRMYVLALSWCVPIRLDETESPFVLVLQVNHPSAAQILQHAITEGILPGLLLPALGYVCRVRLQEGAGSEAAE
jgi:hypothetical protein